MDRQAIQERFGIIGTSSAIRHVIERVRQVAGTDISVVIEGESGVGKELVAHALHELSPRRHNNLVIVNCGAIPEGLIESELFGAEKGAYTGATERRSGYFEDADRGTIFLDEIGEMPASAQVRLLRVLETGQFSRVGSSTLKQTDVRIIAATNKDLSQEVRANRFREDLYYRLTTVIIRIPPLRERPEDILPIFEHFLFQFSRKYSTPLKRLDDRAKEFVRRYDWPGNVRELRNAAEQATVLVREEIIAPEKLHPFLRGVSSSRGLTLASQSQNEDAARARERELIYRILLELRMEMRELKNAVRSLVHQGDGEHRDVRHERAFDREDDYIIMDEERGGGGLRLPYDPERSLPAHRERPSRSLSELASMIEDVPFEIENGEPPQHGDSSSEVSEGDETEAQENTLPTLEEAELSLIREALKRFNGNRRQTARALGISERTLYRKLKDVDEFNVV